MTEKHLQKEKMDLKKLASLVKLSLTEEEEQEFLADLSFLLDLADSLPEVQKTQTDFDGMGMTLREDEPHPFLETQRLLSNSPAERENEISVPEIMEE